MAGTVELLKFFQKLKISVRRDLNRSAGNLYGIFLGSPQLSPRGVTRAVSGLVTSHPKWRDLPGRTHSSLTGVCSGKLPGTGLEPDTTWARIVRKSDTSLTRLTQVSRHTHYKLTLKITITWFRIVRESSQASTHVPFGSYTNYCGVRLF